MLKGEEEIICDIPAKLIKDGGYLLLCLARTRWDEVLVSALHL